MMHVTRRFRSLIGLPLALPLALSALPLMAQEGAEDAAPAAEAGAEEGAEEAPAAAEGTTENESALDGDGAVPGDDGETGDDGAPTPDPNDDGRAAGSDNAGGGGGNEGRNGDNGGKPDKAAQDDLFEDAGPEIPVSEYVPEAERMLTEMRTELTKALDTLARARSEKDAVKLNYVNEQVTNMKGILRISEDAYINLQEAVSTNAMEKARYEFGKIRVSHRKMKELAAAVQNAKGAEASYTGGTDVQLEVDQAIVGGDPYYGNQDFFNTPETGVVDHGDDGVGGDEPPDARPQPASAT